MALRRARNGATTSGVAMYSGNIMAMISCCPGRVINAQDRQYRAIIATLAQANAPALFSRRIHRPHASMAASRTYSRGLRSQVANGTRVSRVCRKMKTSRAEPGT